MILIEDENRIIGAILHKRRTDNKDALDVTIADFDGITYHITSESGPNVKISIHWRAMDDIMKQGGKAMVSSEYSGMSTKSESGYDLSINVNSADDSQVAKATLLRRNLFAAPIRELFDGKSKGGVIQFRPDGENVYLKPNGADRVAVSFSIAFRDPDDIVFAKIFLQEFADARRRITNAPAVTFYTKDPPAELKSFGVKPRGNVCFAMFLLFDRQTKGKERESTISLVMNFRDYLHYHIKCAKAYLHTRMRRRVELWQRVLKKAKPQPKERVMKTYQGKAVIPNH